jgi:hypothetical protein
VTLQNASTATPSFTTAHQAGTLVFTLTVTDNEGASATVTTQVVVVNQTPVANAGASQTANEGVSVTLNGTASSDPDGNIASYSWTQTSGPVVTLQNANTATPSFTTPHQAGTLKFALTVTDNEGATASSTTQVTVVNQAPVANAGPDQSVKYNAIVNLDGRASHDADGSIVSYRWLQTGGPAVTLAGATTATPSFRAPHADAHLSFALTVTDNEGAQATDTVNVSTAKK